jgi:hypothetical protein
MVGDRPELLYLLTADYVLYAVVIAVGGELFSGTYGSEHIVSLLAVFLSLHRKNIQYRYYTIKRIKNQYKNSKI